MQTLAEEKEDAVRSKTDLEDDWDLALEAARYEAARRVREATENENASRGTTFSFFNTMFPPYDDELPEDDPHPRIPAEAAQSTTHQPDGEAVDGFGASCPEEDEEQIDFSSE